MAGVSREMPTGKFNGFYVEGRRTHTKFTTPRLMEVRDRWLLLLLLYHLLIASHFAFLIQSAYCFAFKCFLLDGEIVFASFWFNRIFSIPFFGGMFGDVILLKILFVNEKITWRFWRDGCWRRPGICYRPGIWRSSAERIVVRPLCKRRACYPALCGDSTSIWRTPFGRLLLSKLVHRQQQLHHPMQNK